jgi:Cof subfamily protein (haloacid dehalogenase superfamily)
MIAVDLDGTLLGADGRCGPRNRAALLAAEEAGIVVAIATGRRHCYAMHVLRELGLRDDTLLVSSNGAVVRTLGSELIERTMMERATAAWLCGHLGEFRNALVVTFDRVQPNGEDTRGALVVEDFEDLVATIGPWMQNNEPYVALVKPIELALADDQAIQMMLCGTVDRMRRAEARMMENPQVAGVGDLRETGLISLARTEYAGRNLSILDILPSGVSKGAALKRLAESRGFGARHMMAMGDNWNDLSMLEVAGCPVLMGNAPAELHTMASERGWSVTSHHHADGVADAIFREFPELEAMALTVGAFAGSKQVW